MAVHDDVAGKVDEAVGLGDADAVPAPVVPPPEDFLLLLHALSANALAAMMAKAM